jgi:phage N-6-adenine-methyltransferase
MSFGESKKGKASASDEWTTPKDLVAGIVEKYGPIVLDVAATKANAVAPRFITKEQNALASDWILLAGDEPGIIFDNPPFSKPNKPAFIQHAIDTARRGRTVANVVPANMRDRWLHEKVLSRVVGGGVSRAQLGKRNALLLTGRHTDLWFLEGSVTFGSPLNPEKNGNTAGVLVAVFHGEAH